MDHRAHRRRPKSRYDYSSDDEEDKFEDYWEAEDQEDQEDQEKNSKKPETMSSWLQRQATSHQAQLAGAAVLSGAAVAGAIFGYQAVKRQAAIKELKSSIPDISDQYQAQNVCGYLVEFSYIAIIFLAHSTGPEKMADRCK